MTASDFFENFLLHDGVKSLHPNENLSIVYRASCLVRRRHDRRILCKRRLSVCGAVVRRASAAPVGEAQLPRLCQIPSSFRPGAALTAFFFSL